MYSIQVLRNTKLYIKWRKVYRNLYWSIGVRLRDFLFQKGSGSSGGSSNNSGNSGSSSSSGSSTCRDTHSKGTNYCQEWISACRDDKYVKFRNVCKKTCGVCGSSCKDTHSKGSDYCRKWKKSCSDERYQVFANNCRKTCGRCS